jgi:PAS domain S-box-containing protein
MGQEAIDVQAMIDALDERVDELSNRAFEIFIRVVPEARQWSEKQRTLFVEQARGRFGAVLAVTEHGAEVDEALQRDLKEVGANAAWASASLPQLLLVLRISRDVLLQAALRIAEERGSQWNAVTLTFAQRMLPSIDRLTDAIGNGYWNARVERTKESLERFESLVERIPYGIYEVDIDGIVQYANPALAILVGRGGQNLIGQPLGEILKPTNGNIAALLSEPPDDIAQSSIVVSNADGEPLTLDVDMVVRRSDQGDIVGFAGLMRQAGAIGVAVDLTPLIRHIHELRRSVEILEDAGEFLGRNASVMTPDQVTQAGQSVARQAERLMIIIDELDADRRAIQPSSAS